MNETDIWLSDDLPAVPAAAELASVLGDDGCIFDSLLADDENEAPLQQLQQHAHGQPRGVRAPKRRLAESDGDATPTEPRRPAAGCTAGSPAAKKRAAPRRKGAEQGGKGAAASAPTRTDAEPSAPTRTGAELSAPALAGAEQSAPAQSAPLQLVSSKPRGATVSKRARAKEDLETMRTLMLHYIFNF